MKMSFFTISILLGAIFVGPSYAKEVKDVVPEVVQAAADPAVVKAVKEANAKGLTMEKILELDKAWIEIMDAKKEPTAFMKSFSANATAKVLEKVEKAKPYFVEFILTDNQGANVALTGMTSDYWQGDEPKFTNAFANGKGDVYIARPQKDKSTGEVISQVSVPVMSDGKAIGTLTVGVRAEKLK